MQIIIEVEDLKQVMKEDFQTELQNAVTRLQDAVTRDIAACYSYGVSIRSIHPYYKLSAFQDAILDVFEPQDLDLYIGGLNGQTVFKLLHKSVS